MKLTKPEYNVVKGFLSTMYKLSLDESDYYLNELNERDSYFLDLSLNKSSKVTYYPQVKWDE